MKRTDAAILDEDVYIIKVERSLFKVDKEVLQHIPKLSIAFKDGHLHPGQPFYLNVPCQPRVIKDVLLLLKKQVEGLDPYENFQSAQIDVDNDTLRLVQQLQFADVLNLETLAKIIVNKIRTLCADIGGFDKALRYTRFGKCASSRNALVERIFGSQTSSVRAGEKIPLYPLKIFTMPMRNESKAFRSRYQHEQDVAKTGHRRKREPSSQTDDSETHTRASKKTRTIADGLGSETQPVLRNPPPSPRSYGALVLDPILDFSQTHIHDKELPRLDDADEWRVCRDGHAIDKDKFERDQDGMDVVEQDSFELDEDEVTSGDIDELVMSDPVKFECIASSQTPRKNTALAVTKDQTIAVSSPLSQSKYAFRSDSFITLARAQRRSEPCRPTFKPSPILSSQSDDISTNEEESSAPMDPLSSPIPVSSQGRRSKLFDLEHFYCKAIDIKGAGSDVFIHSDQLRFYYSDKTILRDTLFKLDFSTILQFKVTHPHGDTPVIQILLRSGVLSSNLCYLVFKCHSDLSDFVDKVRQFYSNLRVIYLDSGIAERLLSAASSAYSKRPETTVPTETLGMADRTNVNITDLEDDRSPDQGLLSVHGKPHVDIESRSPSMEDSKVDTSTKKVKKRLFHHEPIDFEPIDFEPMRRLS